MSIWKFLGFGINHERIAKYNQKEIEAQNIRIEGLCREINYFGIHKLLGRKDYDVKDIKAVLNHFKEPPIKSTNWEKNWPEAQQWLYEQEHPEILNHELTQKELKEMKKKMQEMEEKLAEYENKK